MREENVFVIVSLLFISLAALALAGWMVYMKVQSAPLTALIMIPSSAVSGLIGYMTKGLIDKAKDSTGGGTNSGYIRTGALLALAVMCIMLLCIFGGCTNDGAFIKVKESTYCSQLPDGEYSIICEITKHFNTTPEAVRIVTKVANIAGVDQWYSARAADKFLEDVQKKNYEFRSSGGATWAQFANYALGRYAALPPKLKGMVNITKDLFEFNPPSIAGRLLSDLDWDRIEGNIQEQRALLAGFINK